MQVDSGAYVKILSKLSNKYSLKQIEKSKQTSSAIIYGTHIADGLPITIKLILCKDRSSDLIGKMQTFMRFKHPNLIKIIDCFYQKPYLVVLFEGGQENLKDYLNRVKPNIQEKQQIMRQILRVNNYLFSEEKVMHRDIKLQNFVRFDNVWKLIDFKFMTQTAIETNMSRSQLGNVFGMAPQIIKHQQYNYKSDIWSLGVLYYRMIFGNYPFKENEIKLMQAQPYRNLGVSNLCNKESADFIRSCLRFKPENRPDWASIMRHPIMTETNVNSIVQNQNSVTRSGKFFDHDQSALLDVFQMPEDQGILNSQVLKKIRRLRKRVVIYDALFLQFSDVLIKNLLKDTKQNKYQHRQCLIPLLGHALYHIFEVVNLLKNKNFVKIKTYNSNNESDITEVRVQNTEFTKEEVDLFCSYKLRPKSLLYFQNIQKNLNARVLKYSQNIKIREFLKLNKQQYNEAIKSVKSVLQKAQEKAQDPVLLQDIKTLFLLIDNLLKSENGCFLDSLVADCDFENFVKKFLYKTIIQQPKSSKEAA